MSKLFMGVSKKDITPKIGCRLYGYRPNFFSEKVHDRLEASAFVFEKDGLKCVLISATVVGMQKVIADEIKKTIEEKTGINKDNILICATHTHTGPATTGTGAGWGGLDTEYVQEIFIPQLVAATVEANEKLVPVKMGVAEGNSYVGVNRRQFDETNMVQLGQRPWGAFNPKMTVMSFCDYDGNVLGNIIHYGCHCTAGGHVLEISRDWSGIMTDRLEAVSGGITGFINGPEGDIGPRLTNGRTVGHDVKYIEEVGGVAAADAVRIFKTIKVYEPEAELGFRLGSMKITTIPRIPLEEAKVKLDEYNKQENLVNINMLIKKFYENTVDSYSKDYKETEYREIEQGVLRIGNEVIVGYPYEIFSEIGLRIQSLVKDVDVLPTVEVNGVIGYIPTQKELIHGGYEVNHFKYNNIQPFADDADFQFVNETIKNVEELICTE